jgi:hypothetical protein
VDAGGDEAAISNDDNGSHPSEIAIAATPDRDRASAVTPCGMIRPMDHFLSKRSLLDF